MEEDPNFMPGMDLLALDELNYEQLDVDDGAQSLLSPHGSQTTNFSQQSVGGLMLPPSDSSFAGGPVGGFGSFGILGDSGRGSKHRFDQPVQLLDDDPIFTVEDDGTMNFDAGLEDQQQRSPSRRIIQGRSSGHGSGWRSDQVGDGLVSEVHCEVSIIKPATNICRTICRKTTF
jgi:hypothetical protein